MRPSTYLQATRQSAYQRTSSHPCPFTNSTQDHKGSKVVELFKESILTPLPYPSSRNHPRCYRRGQVRQVKNKKIRCVASGYTWSSSSVVQEDGMLVFVDKMTKIFPQVFVEGQSWNVEMETGVKVKALDEYLRRNDPPRTMTSNIVMGEHGAATQSRTLSDLACEVKIVDATGTLNTFTRDKDPVEFSVAACNLGLLGVIYSYTLRVEPMFNLSVVGGARLKEMVLQNDQTQILYWPFNSHYKCKGETVTVRYAKDELWIKHWKRTDQPESVTFAWKLHRRVRQYIASALGSSTFRLMVAKPKTVRVLSGLFHRELKRPAEKILAAPDAIHYMANLEAAVVIGLEGEYPVNMTVDMRFIKSSDQIMSYVYGEDPEAIFCTMEILAVAETRGFEDFSAMLAQHLMSEYKARVHWAKLWEHIPGIVPYLREHAGPQLDRFESIRKKYDPQGIFLNKTFAGVLGHR
ncbi:hypothetical protein BGZ90_010853 [Linnemannia elongata]|nr:hypothetical protein BGZ90_010853 [Linnemannia elongata]